MILRCVIGSHPNLSKTIGPQGFDHPDQAAFTLAVNALNAAEGFLWKAIRGTGLAYGAYIYSNPESGHVYLDIDRSPDSWQAAATAGQVMKDLISKKVSIHVSHSLVFFLGLGFFFSFSNSLDSL